MTKKILVAGATGDLGGRIVNALRERGADVKALIRSTTDPAKVEKLEQKGITVSRTHHWNLSELTEACADVSCIVSAMQGLHDVIVDAQSVLLDAAVAAGVRRFIPSDYASDFTKLPIGYNRNFDLRREFHEYLDKAQIRSTSILNGAFAEILKYNIPLLNFKTSSVGYYGDPDFRVDFSTMDNVAAYTAEAALDDTTPGILRIASFQISPRELRDIASDILKINFELVNLGSLDELAEYNKRERAAHPESENDIYASWQRTQYTHSMFSVQLSPLDNFRYPTIKWTGVREVLGKR